MSFLSKITGGITGGSILDIAAGLYTSHKDRTLTRDINQESANESERNRMFQDKEAEEAWNRSETSAKNQRDFEERMSNTSYQRSMQDLKAAGLNPMLAFSQGGASTPSGASGSAHGASGSQASFQKSDYSKLLNESIQKAVSSSIDKKRVDKEVDLANSQKSVNDQLINTQKAQEKLYDATAMKTAVDSIISRWNANSAKSEAEYKNELLKHKKYWAPWNVGVEAVTKPISSMFPKFIQD